ncbi:uncharacterized protein [Arachis hypogaea]|uniref:uncharacterized protein isoform X2 n=1 Tax=Arachis hypogaea TaxID=3818 RepID=UPI000DEC4BCB|nr:uncharacterized protein LOC112789721 isoform X2 [Arachis hypogaea]
MDKRLKDIEDKTTAFKEMQAKVKKEMESVQESNSVINGGGESSNNNDQVPKVANFLGVRKAEEDSLSSNLVALTTHLFTGWSANISDANDAHKHSNVLVGEF